MIKYEVNGFVLSLQTGRKVLSGQALLGEAFLREFGFSLASVEEVVKEGPSSFRVKAVASARDLERHFTGVGAVDVLCPIQGVFKCGLSWANRLSVKILDSDSDRLVGRLWRRGMREEYSAGELANLFKWALGGKEVYPHNTFHDHTVAYHPD